MTCQEELDARKLVEAKVREALYVKLRAVYKLLGFQPEIVKHDYDAMGDGVRGFGAIKGDMQLYASANTYSIKGRVSFSVGYPKPKAGERSDYQLGYPTITVSLGKTPEQIAAEVTRRLIPDYEAALVTVRERNSQTEEYHAKRDENLARILGRALRTSGAGDQERREGKAQLELVGDVWGTVQAYADGATLELRSVPVELAARIVAILKEGAKKVR